MPSLPPAGFPVPPRPAMAGHTVAWLAVCAASAMAQDMAPVLRAAAMSRTRPAGASEDYCSAFCLAQTGPLLQGYCCNSPAEQPSTSMNGLYSCHQACMMRQRGVSMGTCLEAVHRQADIWRAINGLQVQNGFECPGCKWGDHCEGTVGGVSYALCGSCEDGNCRECGECMGKSPEPSQYLPSPSEIYAKPDEHSGIKGCGALPEKYCTDFCLGSGPGVGYCCNSPAEQPSTSMNGLYSCHQACMMRQRGVSMGTCLEAVGNQTDIWRKANDQQTALPPMNCSATVEGVSYEFCGSCEDGNCRDCGACMVRSPTPGPSQYLPSPSNDHCGDQYCGPDETSGTKGRRACTVRYGTQSAPERVTGVEPNTPFTPPGLLTPDPDPISNAPGLSPDPTPPASGQQPAAPADGEVPAAAADGEVPAAAADGEDDGFSQSGVVVVVLLGGLACLALLTLVPLAVEVMTMERRLSERQEQEQE
eukprot:gene5007-901_t